MSSGIYAIVAPSGKFYVGSAVDFRRRWNGHRSRLMRGVHHCPGLLAASQKYGMSNLEFVVLALVEPIDLLTAEQFFIDKYKGRLYNSSPIAGSRLGRGQTPATRAKISAARTGQLKSAETKARMSTAQVGRVVSEAARAKIAEASRGRVQSVEIRAKRSDALRGRAHKDNATGLMGVGPFRGRFRARWANRHLGLFDTAEAAHAAVTAAAGLLDART